MVYRYLSRIHRIPLLFPKQVAAQVCFQKCSSIIVNKMEKTKSLKDLGYGFNSGECHFDQTELHYEDTGVKYLFSYRLFVMLMSRRLDLTETVFIVIEKMFLYSLNYVRKCSKFNSDSHQSLPRFLT